MVARESGHLFAPSSRIRAELTDFAFQLLLPFSLYGGAKGGFHNQSLIAMIAVGAVCLLAYPIYEWKFAKFPSMPKRVLFNRSFATAILINVVYFLVRFSCLPPSHATILTIALSRGPSGPSFLSLHRRLTSNFSTSRPTSTSLRIFLRATGIVRPCFRSFLSERSISYPVRRTQIQTSTMSATWACQLLSRFSISLESSR